MTKKTIDTVYIYRTIRHDIASLILFSILLYSWTMLGPGTSSIIVTLILALLFWFWFVINCNSLRRLRRINRPILIITPNSLTYDYFYNYRDKENLSLYDDHYLGTISWHKITNLKIYEKEDRGGDHTHYRAYLAIITDNDKLLIPLSQISCPIWSLKKALEPYKQLELKDDYSWTTRLEATQIYSNVLYPLRWLLLIVACFICVIIVHA